MMTEIHTSPLVLVESPYFGSTDALVRVHETYARLCLHDCFMRGELPFASHLLYTQPGILNDRIPEERNLGIEAGLRWGQHAEKTVLYTDFGHSSGMEHGIKTAENLGRPVEKRTLSEIVIMDGFKEFITGHRISGIQSLIVPITTSEIEPSGLIHFELFWNREHYYCEPASYHVENWKRNEFVMFKYKHAFPDKPIGDHTKNNNLNGLRRVEADNHGYLSVYTVWGYPHNVVVERGKKLEKRIIGLPPYEDAYVRDI